MKNVIPINLKARQIRDAMLHPRSTSVTVFCIPRMPPGYWALLIAYTGTWVYSDLDIPLARMLVGTAKGTRFYVDLRTT